MENEEFVSCRSRPWELKETARCVFCRGVNCKRCSATAYLHAHSPAIEKFHCNWITDEILAMQRPADELFDSIDLLGQFKSLRITAVLNLTEPGEHPFCGFGIKASGFPYTPEKLMSVGIKHFNFAWRDMTAPSISLTQNVVRVGMAELLEGGKVAVHCHAGFGRTGIVVACLIMARTGMSADEAVQIVRSKRPGSVQTSAQLNFIRDFEREYLFQKSVYPLINFKSLSSTHEDDIDDVPTIILSKPPLHRKSTISDTINRRLSFRKSSMLDKILPSTPPNVNSSLSSSSSIRFTPRITPSSSSLLSSTASTFYVQLKSIDMSIIDEKLCNIEHFHPHHESFRQITEQPPADVKSSSIVLQIIIKLFQSFSQAYHPLYLCSILCGYPHQHIFTSLYNFITDSVEGDSLVYPQLTPQDLNELKTSLRQYRTFSNQSDWKKFTDTELITNPVETHEESKTSNQKETSVPHIHFLNSLTLSNMLFDWFDTREDTLFSAQFMDILQKEAFHLINSEISSSCPVLARYRFAIPESYFIPPHIHSSNLQDGQQKKDEKVVPTLDDSLQTSQNFFDLFLRKHLSRTKLCVLEEILSLFHQFDSLTEMQYQKFHHLLFAMEMRIALSCLEETHRSLLTQYLAEEFEKKKQNEFSEKNKSDDPQPLQEEVTILTFLYRARQMNIQNISALFSSGIIATSPSLSISLLPKSESSLSFTPIMYQSLSQLLLAINLFHSLLSINWVNSKRNTKHIIRWRKSFVGTTPAALACSKAETETENAAGDSHDSSSPS